MQVEPILVFSDPNKPFLLKRELIIEEKIFVRANAAEDMVQPGELKQYGSDPAVSRYYQCFSTSANEICQGEEDLNRKWVQMLSGGNTRIDAANGVCFRRCLGIRRQSPCVR